MTIDTGEPRRIRSPARDRRAARGVGLGASWPRIDRDSADPAACFAVAGILGAMAGLSPAARAERPGYAGQGLAGHLSRYYS